MRIPSPSRNPAPLSALLLGFLLTLTIEATGTSQPAGFQESFHRATELLRQGEWEASEEIFIKLLDANWQTALVHHNLGVISQRQRRHDEAIHHFQQALQLDPTLHNSRALLGISLIAQGNVQEGTRELEAAAANLPGRSEVHLQLAEAYGRQGRILEGVTVLEKLARSDPENPEYAYQLGRAYLRLSQWALARLAEVTPPSPRLHQSIGQTQMMQGNLEAAVKSFQAAIALDPSMLDLHLNLAHIYFRMGKLTEALSAVEKELGLMPANEGAQQLKQEIEKRLAESGE